MRMFIAGLVVGSVGATAMIFGFFAMLATREGE